MLLCPSVGSRTSIVCRQCIAILCSILFIFAAEVSCAVPSGGCGHRNVTLPVGKLFLYESMQIHDPVANMSAVRSFYLYIPVGYIAAEPSPLLLWLHGQSGNASTAASEMQWGSYPLISAYPQGLDDYADGGVNCGTGWSVPGAHNTSTCISSASPQCCYASCRAMDVCNGDGEAAKCGWATCHDDVAFLKAIVQHLTEMLCVDKSAMYLAGSSNGGMLVHHAFQAMPGTFRAILPVYGSPLLGFSNVPPQAVQSSILMLFDRNDGEVPVRGGLMDGWYYEAAAAVLQDWAAMLECGQHSFPLHTPHDGGPENLTCVEWPGCAVGEPPGPSHRVVLCLFDGHHGDWPAKGRAEALGWWFFTQPTTGPHVALGSWGSGDIAAATVCAGTMVIVVIVIVIAVVFVRRRFTYTAHPPLLRPEAV
eukprot:TRINITY_DN45905_c0_g1_i1.p1 TRINITY_DN45905_c0_g1~~TRINITY_DN45905_c0_g1_i1.p1  ORF type:complete len:421 (-),score=21.92 TRINITY_DN45905_c0_g1_i1:24-1286(-)